ncbi:MAG TPA: exodeoxyribonuclease VII small subunit [Acidobacteriota bacterium]|jgi:exodeoxyribonuclease VII small subunit|nr:exodeoxyribonuclease VII small subunit [Acidobacteriota bacterium]
MEFKDFEDALKALEDIVARLEKGDLPLETALELFEQGVQISKFCNSKLTEAERKVEILLKDKKGEMQAEPFQITVDGQE